ncbi:MAG: hypothetical protein ACHQD9_04855 [Chitinophagales bacterium]
MSLQAIFPLFDEYIEVIATYNLSGDPSSVNHRVLTIVHAVISHHEHMVSSEKPVDEFCGDGLSELASHPGFVDFYFMKVDHDKSNVIIIWENADCARSGADAFGPKWFVENFHSFLT